MSTVAGKLPAPRHKHSACLIGNQVWFFGGMDAPPNGFNDFYVLTLSPSLLDQFLPSSSTATQTKEQLPQEKDTSQKRQIVVVEQSNLPHNAQSEVSKIREELDRCYARLAYISAQNLHKFTLSELEELEEFYHSNLPKIAAAKVEFN